MCTNPKQKIYYWFIIFSQFVQICKVIPISMFTRLHPIKMPPPIKMIHSLQRVIPISERVCLWDNWGITESTFIYLTRLHWVRTWYDAHPNSVRLNKTRYRKAEVQDALLPVVYPQHRIPQPLTQGGRVVVPTMEKLSVGQWR